MPTSLESARPILPRQHVSAPKRLSTYSAPDSLTPSLAASDDTIPDPRTADIKTWESTFERLMDKRLAQQRYVPSPAKSESLSKLALGAKLERALGRRMTGQDAVFTRRITVSSPLGLSEKITMNSQTAA